MNKGRAIIRDHVDMLTVSYEDLDVEAFGGSDYEVIYTLDRENRDRLVAELRKEGGVGTTEEMIRAGFGDCLDHGDFGEWCGRHSIEYKLFTWIG